MLIFLIRRLFLAVIPFLKLGIEYRFGRYFCVRFVKVPTGIAFLGSFRSPLIAIPAVKPVTAGKKMANTTAIDSEPLVAYILMVSGAYSVVPKKMEIKEIIIAVRIKNWALIAAEVLISASAVKAVNAIAPLSERH